MEEVPINCHCEHSSEGEYEVTEGITGRSSWLLKYYRPRRSLARTLYQKQLVDNYLNTFDKTQWYHCNLELLPKNIAERFILLNEDEDTQKFLQQSEYKSDWIMTQIWHTMAKAFLGWFMTQTSINGSSRQSYGDSAVGYVQVKLDDNFCFVQARITPEHKVHNQNYHVSAKINIEEDIILECQCYNCVASQGGCKHAIAFLFWLHRRSEEPSPTEELCYWKKSDLSKVGTSQKFLLLSDITTIPTIRTSTSTNVAKEFLSKNKNKELDCLMLNMARPPAYHLLSLRYLAIGFKDEDLSMNVQHFLNFCSTKMTNKDCIEAAVATTDQSKSTLWHELRYGRITASKIYEASRCSTDGSLIESIFGASKFIPTSAMQRGLFLENKIIKVLEKNLNITTRKCGLILDPQLPVFGASPDAITNDYVIEVKCPAKNIENFIKNGKIVEKCEAQIQLQMKMCKKEKGIFVVAHPDFETSNNISNIEVKYNDQLCQNLIVKAMAFWERFVFPKLHYD